MSNKVWYYPGEPSDLNDSSKGTPSLVKQVQCPADAPSKTGTGGGVKFAFAQALPESIGQMVGGNFTGLGRNDGSFMSKAGLNVNKGYADSKRIYGQNYYLPLQGKVCGRGSTGGCRGQQAHMYIRSYPVGFAKANLSFAIVEDLLDINPVTVLMSMFQTVGGVQCRRQVLPVGNSFDMESGFVVPGKQSAFINVRDILKDTKKTDADKTKAIKQILSTHYTGCQAICNQKTTRGTSKRDNCYKDCLRVWWEENKCAIQQKGLSYVTVEYPIRITTTVVYTTDKKNLVFYLPTGVFVRAIFSDVLTVQKVNSLKHLLSLGGMVYPKSSDMFGGSSKTSQQQSQPLIGGKEVWTMDDRAYYVASYNPAAFTYTLNVYNGQYQADVKKRGDATTTVSVTVPKTISANVTQNQVTFVNGGKTQAINFKKQSDKSYIATFENSRSTVPYNIPAVSLSKKEQSDNTADTDVNVKEPFDNDVRSGSNRGGPFTNGQVLEESEQMSIGWWWTAAAALLSIALFLLLLRHKYAVL